MSGFLFQLFGISLIIKISIHAQTIYSCPSNEEGSATQPQILAKQTKGCLVLPVLFKLLYDGTQSATEEAYKCWLHCCLFP